MYGISRKTKTRNVEAAETSGISTSKARDRQVESVIWVEEGTHMVACKTIQRDKRKNYRQKTIFTGGDSRRQRK